MLLILSVIRPFRFWGISMWRFKKINTSLYVLRNLESDDRRVLVIFNSPTNSKISTKYNNSVLNNMIPVDPAGGHCYWDPTKPCESRGFGPRQTAQ